MKQLNPRQLKENNKFDELVYWVLKWFGTNGVKELKRAIKRKKKEAEETTSMDGFPLK